MAKQSPAQQETVASVMRAFKHGELEGRDDKPIRNPKQAIAIALHEAGASRTEDAATNRRNLARTKRRERADGETRRRDRDAPSKAELYAEARRRDLPGRSRMSKAELSRALGR